MASIVKKSSKRKSKNSFDFQALYNRLFALYGQCTCPLVHNSPFQLLCAVMLSAQCKDERVNQVTKELFSLAPDAPKMVQLDQKKIAQIIHPCGLYENKSKNLKGIAQKIVEDFNNIVPQTMDELTTLPGIGRKSANVVLGNAFNIPGFPVDTHVNRVLNKLGAVKSSNPVTIEEDVCQNIDDIYWTNFSHLLITFGRQICHARSPECENCPLQDMCKFYKG